jgi:hypothetical protein
MNAPLRHPVIPAGETRRETAPTPFVSVSFDCCFCIEDMDRNKLTEQDARASSGRRGAWR